VATPTIYPSSAFRSEALPLACAADTLGHCPWPEPTTESLIGLAKKLSDGLSFRQILCHSERSEESLYLPKARRRERDPSLRSGDKGAFPDT